MWLNWGTASAQARRDPWLYTQRNLTKPNGTAPCKATWSETKRLKTTRCVPTCVLCRFREKAIASGQGSSLKLAAAVKLLADYLFLTVEKASAMEFYKEALARVEARTEHDRAKPQTQSFSAQVWARRGRWGGGAEGGSNRCHALLYSDRPAPLRT